MINEVDKVHREVSLNEDGKDRDDDSGEDESAGPNLLAMIAWAIGVSGRCRRVYLPPFFPL